MAEQYTKDELAEWFTGKLSSLKPGSRGRLLSAEERWTDDTDVFVGGLFFFKYDAKTKDRLPMWDKYPLCVPIDRFADGFLGLNLHYLPAGRRNTVITMVDAFKKDNKLSNTVRAKAKNWQYMMNTTNVGEAYFRKSVKRYLFSNVRTQFIRLNPDEYQKAVQLPIEEWVFKR